MSVERTWFLTIFGVQSYKEMFDVLMGRKGLGKADLRESNGTSEI